VPHLGHRRTKLVGVELGEYELVCLALKAEDGDGAPARAILRR
jgi:kynurenine formamidase